MLCGDLPDTAQADLYTSQREINNHLKAVDQTPVLNHSYLMNLDDQEHIESWEFQGLAYNGFCHLHHKANISDVTAKGHRPQCVTLSRDAWQISI